VALLLGGSPKRKSVDRHADRILLRAGLAHQRIPFSASAGLDAGLRGFDVGNGGGSEQTDSQKHAGRSSGSGPRFTVLRECQGIGEIQSSPRTAQGLPLPPGQVRRSSIIFAAVASGTFSRCFRVTGGSGGSFELVAVSTGVCARVAVERKSTNKKRPSRMNVAHSASQVGED